MVTVSPLTNGVVAEMKGVTMWKALGPMPDFSESSVAVLLLQLLLCPLNLPWDWL